ncbi:MAG: MFS transporter [Pseudomonadota bacterium]
MKHTLRAFRHRNYRLFFYGQSLSVIGTWIQLIAMSWLVYRLTGSAWLLGVTGFAGQIAILLFAPFGGIWADRFDRRKLLIVTQGLAMVQGLLLAGLGYAGAIEVWHIIVMATLLGVVMAFDTPIRQSFTSEMVPDQRDLPSALAFNGFMQNSGRMIGPTIAGLLLAVTSEAFCFLVNGISKIAVVTSILLMVIPARPKSATAARVWHGMREGMVYAWNIVPIRVLLPMLALVSVTATPYQTLMPIFAAEVYAGGAETLGFLVGAAGLGGVVGMLYLASRRDVRGLTRWPVYASGIAGMALILFAYSQLLWFSLAMIAVAGFGIIVTAMSVSTVFQTIVEDQKRGRVMSFFTMAFLGMQPVGSLLAGALASWIGATHTLAAGGACCIAGALVLWRKLPLLRLHIRPIYIRLGIIDE